MLTSSEPNNIFVEDKFTDYQFEGQEIVAVKRPGNPGAYKRPDTWFSKDQKTDAATLYCVYGDIEQVSKLTNVPAFEIKKWREEPWWAEVQRKVYIEQNEHLSARVSEVLMKAIDQIKDRLDNGDQTYNPKTGAITRKPIEAKVLTSLFDSLAHQRRITRGEPTSISARIGTDERLQELEKAFIRFTQSKEIIQEKV